MPGPRDGSAGSPGAGSPGARAAARSGVGAGGRRAVAGAAPVAGAGARVSPPTSARKAYRDTPQDAHEWVSFDDPDEARTWVFDVTFLLSGWQCIYGHGCQGVLTGPAPEMAQGCCSYGAHFTDEDDVARVQQAAKTLTDEQWQYARTGRRAGIVQSQPDGTRVTRLVHGACVFLNRPGFPGGPGCALHRAALERGVAPLELKPDVCWQLPLRREDSSGDAGRVISTVTQWDRRHWGDGGTEFHWWCTEAPEAFRSRRPVYLSLGAELTAMVGAATYQRLVAYLQARHATGVPLPHPVLRTRGRR